MDQKVANEIVKDITQISSSILKEIKLSIPETDLYKRSIRLRKLFLELLNLVDEIKIEDPTFYKSIQQSIQTNLTIVISRILKYSVLISARVFSEVHVEGTKFTEKIVIEKSGLGKKIFATLNADINLLKKDIQKNLTNIINTILKSK